MTPRYDFASDNTSGLCPEAMAALVEANEGFCASYGDDPHTERATDLIRQLFETECDVYFVFNGTAANSLALASLCQSYHSVVCHEAAHIETDECGAPEFFSNGTKILLTSGTDGKLDCAEIEKMILRRSDIHYPKPRAVSLAQSTEFGTLKAMGANAIRTSHNPPARSMPPTRFGRLPMWRDSTACACIWMEPALPMRLPLARMPLRPI